MHTCCKQPYLRTRHSILPPKPSPVATITQHSPFQKCMPLSLSLVCMCVCACVRACMQASMYAYVILFLLTCFNYNRILFNFFPPPLCICLMQNYHTFEVCSFTCYFDVTFQSKFPFKNNIILSFPGNAVSQCKAKQLLPWRQDITETPLQWVFV